MRVDFTPQVGFVKHNTTGPAGWRKHQQPNAPALPTDIANGWPNFGWGGHRVRSSVDLPFYVQVGLKKWGGLGELKPGHDSVADEGGVNAPVGVMVNGAQRATSFNPALTLAPRTRGGPIMPMPTSSGAYGVETSHPPTIIPDNPALDHGVIGLAEAPACPPAATQAEKNAAVAAAHIAAKAPVKPKAPTPRGPGATLRRGLQRPSRNGRRPLFGGGAARYRVR